MRNSVAFFLLASVFALTAHAGAQETEPTDCSDPLLAATAACAAQNAEQQQPSQAPLMPLTGMAPPSMQRPANASYTDTELLATRMAEQNMLLQNLPPEPLTEFQKFIASTSGQVLPIFGANLFRQVPTTFAPLDLVPVPPDYILGPDDELRIRVWGQVNFTDNLRVDRSGDIYLPQIGSIHVAGLPFSALQGHLREAIGRVYRNFDLTADMGQIRAVQVYVTGAARRPGEYTVSSLSTMVDALFASGGPAPNGSLRHIELRRGATIVADFDLYDLLIHGDKSKDVPLESGDVLFIPPVGPQVAMTGSVRNPAIYELKSGETLAQAIADAGGTSVVAEQARISIERIDEHRNRYAMEVDWNPAGLQTMLADGDLIRVFPLVPKFEKTVTLRGNTANPGQFAWHPGMRLRDLIPDKSSLLTRNYWWKRAQLGLPSAEFEPLRSFPRLTQPSSPQELPRQQLLGPPPNTEANSATSGGGEEPSQNNESLAASQQASPVVGALNRPAQNLSAAQRAGSASLAAGQVQSSGMLPPATTRTEVGEVAPEIDWDYAVIQRLDPDTLKTVLIPFDLGKLVLDHDESQDLPLEPGDVVSIFSQADIEVPLAQQTKFVRLDGEFIHAGVYTVRPGETLRELVQRAGGLTPNAYLYGSEFTRVSTRAIQQQRMDEYVQTLEMQMQRGNLALASSPVSSSQDLASGTAAQASEQQLVGRLRQMRATGRIVLALTPGSRGVDALPNLTLENGDRFVVPPVPASINVVGAVYDQSSFLYDAARRAGAYLRLAGGPTRDADRSHVFIIRADGSVVSRAAANSIWGNEFDSLRINPGDTIVVPEKVFKPSALRGFLDWSQLFSQFALGAAALSVIQ